jgi:ABC-type multidrug transport system fused ATPase/permease subunit
MYSTGSFFNALPIITLYIFAGYRLMPSAQQLYSLYSTLKFSKPSIFALHDDFKSLKKISIVNKQNILTFHKEIFLKNISYNYPNSSKLVLKNIDLKINVGERVGLIGPTGSGKTTLINIILGLLQPQKGTLQVDGKIIDKNYIKSWLNLISYVPQNIYLLDDTIVNNIALGKDPANIDKNILNKVTKIACLDNFVNNDLPNKFQTIIGENGIRLSGGQRQRIAIARALYLKPKVLILDEATSALDNQIESMVMESINNLSKELTIIMIAHRLSTLKFCGTIYKIENNTISIIDKKN